MKILLMEIIAISSSDPMTTSVILFISNKEGSDTEIGPWVSKNPQRCTEKVKATISEFWPYVQFSLQRLGTITILCKSGSMMVLYILVVRKPFSVTVLMLCCWLKSPKLHCAKTTDLP